ncbi:MAG: GDP-mannose 4,6-dehydratase [Candidatus Aureabacteria bacterium]|nr:GDP-mannose 4,6-dehydratase [Candidatus Auribacterota bacterium]
MKSALITGVTGQDGSYLAEFLLRKGYAVHGLVRRSSTFNRSRIDPIIRSGKTNFHLHYGDLSDSSSLNRLIEKVAPDEIYNLGAQSHVGISFHIPEYTADVTGLGTLRLLDAIRETKIPARFYNAATSELFGKVKEIPQKETTPFYPRSPYGCSKLFSYWITVNYRESYNVFACNGILFNHESPRRGENFVTRKITLNLARIKLGKLDCFLLGNLNAKRDWGYAPDYVEGMWMMLQQNKPDDYVLATGESHSVREFVTAASRVLGINITWSGKGLHEKGVDKSTGKTIVAIDPKFFRPAEVDYLIGDISYARKKLGWVPKTSFDELVKIMADADLKVVENESGVRE